MQTWRNLIFEMRSRHWNITGPNALVYRETTYKNENSSTEVRDVFLVHSENFSNHPRRNKKEKLFPKYEQVTGRNAQINLKSTRKLIDTFLISQRSLLFTRK